MPITPGARLVVPIGVSPGQHHLVLCLPRRLHVGEQQGDRDGRHEVGHYGAGGTVPSGTVLFEVLYHVSLIFRRTNQKRLSLRITNWLKVDLKNGYIGS